MTRNQIAWYQARETAAIGWAGLEETRRSNKAREGEEQRHNIAYESEVHRHNTVQERISLDDLRERRRHNITQEGIQRFTSIADAENARRRLQLDAYRIRAGVAHDAQSLALKASEQRLQQARLKLESRDMQARRDNDAGHLALQAFGERTKRMLAESQLKTDKAHRRLTKAQATKVGSEAMYVNKYYNLRRAEYELKERESVGKAIAKVAGTFMTFMNPLLLGM